jgi:hypothetical protein
MPSEDLVNHTTGGRGIQDCDWQAREWLLEGVEPAWFKAGQPVVWSYLPQVPPRQICLVEAEVVHAGLFRARIRLRDSAGHILLRWVKPEHLRPKQTNETLQHYPAHQTP